MDLKTLYNEYWETKPYGIEAVRVSQACSQFAAGQRVVDIGCGKGEMAHALAKKGVEVVGIDFSEVAAERARRDGIAVLDLDFEHEQLPFPNASIDGVLFTQTAEHVYDYRPVMKEIRRVLRPGGKLIFGVPNIGHWRFRVWLLLGEFPYIEDSQTHWQHVRFFTLKSARRTLEEFGFNCVEMDGTPGFFSPIYPAFVRWRGFARLYAWLCRVYPALFAFHLTFICLPQRSEQNVA